MIRNLLAKPAVVVIGLATFAGLGLATLVAMFVVDYAIRTTAHPLTPVSFQQYDASDGSAQSGTAAPVPDSSEARNAAVSQFDKEVAAQTAPATQSPESESFDPQANASGSGAQYVGSGAQYVGSGARYAGPAAQDPGSAAQYSRSGAQNAGPASQYAPAAYGPAISWRQQTSPDGTATVALPTNWRIVSGSQGVVALQGPEGANVLLGLQFFVAPNQAGYMGPEQALAWFLRNNRIQVLGIEGRQGVQQNGSGQAEQIVAQTDEQGHKCKLVAIVRTAPIGMGYWMFHISALDAPTERFDAAAPTMAKIYNSWKLDPSYVQGHFDHAAQTRAQTAASMTAWAQSNVHRWDNFNTETDRILRGESVMENTDTGKRVETHIGTEQSVLDACRRNGMNCREVPTSELDQPQ